MAQDPIRFVVWKIIANKKYYEVARFRYKSFADSYCRIQNELYKSVRFEVTKIGDTPVLFD